MLSWKYGVRTDRGVVKDVEWGMMEDVEGWRMGNDGRWGRIGMGTDGMGKDGGQGRMEGREGWGGEGWRMGKDGGWGKREDGE